MQKDYVTSHDYATFENGPWTRKEQALLIFKLRGQPARMDGEERDSLHSVQRRLLSSCYEFMHP
jgi:hypothetical protein